MQQFRLLALLKSDHLQRMPVVQFHLCFHGKRNRIGILNEGCFGGLQEASTSSNTVCYKLDTLQSFSYLVRFLSVGEVGGNSFRRSWSTNLATPQIDI